MTHPAHRLPAWTPRRVPGAQLATGPVASGTRFRQHAHEGVHLCCVLEGGFVESGGAGSADVGPGTVRVSPAARHDIDFGRTGARCILIEFEEEDAGSLGRLDRSLFLRDAWLERLVARLGLVVVDHRPAASVALEAAVVELLAQIARRQGARAARTPPRRLRNARARVHDAQGRESLAELAAAVGVHRAHLARAFRDHYGGTLGGFARRLRVERALRLLAEDDRPLAEIAMDTGFTDQSHMTRAVSAAAGISPGRLRALLRRERATLIQDPRPGAA